MVKKLCTRFFGHFAVADRCSQEETQRRFDVSQSYHTIDDQVSTFSNPLRSLALDGHLHHTRLLYQHLHIANLSDIESKQTILHNCRGKKLSSDHTTKVLLLPLPLTQNVLT